MRKYKREILSLAFKNLQIGKQMFLFFGLVWFGFVGMASHKYVYVNIFSIRMHLKRSK